MRLFVPRLVPPARHPFASVHGIAGPKGIAAILARCPEIMLCKPTTNDRWDRRAVELGAYLLRHGHCNVPEVGTGVKQIAKTKQSKANQTKIRNQRRAVAAPVVG